LINQNAVDNGLAIGNYTHCEILLKKHYNISLDTTLLIKNMQFNPLTNLKNLNDSSMSDSVLIEFINPINGEKLDLNLCNESPTAISIPFKELTRLKPTLYQKAAVLKGIIDLYDKKSPGYYSRCFKSKEFDTGGDTSINYRRTRLYQNESINCSPECSYEGLDNNSYVICNCQISGGGELSNNSTGFDPLFAFPKFNYDIAICYYETYTDVIQFFFIINNMKIKLLSYYYFINI